MPFRGDAHISHICFREEQQPASSDVVLLEDISVALHFALYTVCNNTHIQQEVTGTHEHLVVLLKSKLRYKNSSYENVLPVPNICDIQKYCEMEDLLVNKPVTFQA